ncbi:hypothetical protein IMZ48_34765 [Candidatus Bathyarchaeota archaeon]|nr:hypothetical protein [Candidatus Bathyarchaeota archaeon]
MNAVRCLRPAASRFQPATLPRVVRRYSSSPAYEYIQVTEPSPGVSQGTHPLPPPPPFSITCP